MQKGELFGARRGACTYATTDREGLIEAANGGTLFYDEVGRDETYRLAPLTRADRDTPLRAVASRPVGFRRLDPHNPFKGV